MPTINALTQRLESYLDKPQIDDVRRAYEFAEQAHSGQYRQSGDPYITHPLAVAHILTDMHMDHHSLMAAMLHDVIEDTGVTKDALAEAFNQEIAELVDGVSKITQIQFETAEERQAENFRKMVMAMTQDVRVILIKLADRLHNMRTLHVLPPPKRKRIATETLEIYSPIANRLGMNDVRMEYEDLGFQALYPMRAPLIKKAVKRARGNKKEIITSLESSITQRLSGESIEAKVIGREKHLYSIYSKMREQQKSFTDIMDVFAFRVVVDSVDACYRTLGIIHNHYKPIPGRFKDYIAIPKTNGYQSLHTTLKTPTGAPLEIQIRTHEMEAMANNGIAAHWLYKSDENLSNGAQTRTREWMKGLLDIQQRAGNSLEFIENVKIDLFPDEVYIFTPKGSILELPTGSTPVDFAYAVHTDVGNTCVACRIDGRLSPLSSKLESGQTVKIISAPGASPNPAWLSFVSTAKARSNIRHVLKNLRLSESIALGKRLLEKALSDYNVTVEDLLEERISSELATSGFASFDDLLEDIGQGNRLAPLVARKLVATAEEHNDIEKELEKISLSENKQTLAIRGTEGMILTYAKCCYPLPGDEILGFLSAGRGLVIHRDICKNLQSDLSSSPEKCLTLHWDKQVEGEFTIGLRVELANQRGALAVLAAAISAADSNIDTITMEEKDDSITVINTTITVTDRIHLARVLKRIRSLNNIERIIRIRA